MEEWAKDHEVKGVSGTLLLVYVQPGASKTRIKGLFASTPSRVKISVAAPPTEGQANEKVIKFLAELLGVAAKRVHILSGDTARQKNIWISGVDAMSTIVRLDVDESEEDEEA